MDYFRNNGIFFLNQHWKNVNTKVQVYRKKNI